MTTKDMEEYLVQQKISAINNELIIHNSLVENPSNEAYAFNYIKSAFHLLASQLSYDEESAQIVRDIKDKEERKQTYKNLINFKKCVLKGVGVCRQFAALLALVIANNNSGIVKLGLEIPCQLINCRVLMKTGKYDMHSICAFKIAGQEYFCDLSMAVHNKDNIGSFCLVTKQELQQAFNYFDNGAKIDTRIARFDIKNDSIIKLFTSLQNFCDNNTEGIGYVLTDF